MRCKHCGSTSVWAETQHKSFSGGKAVAGAVLFGPIGAAAGFIGKDKKGYMCHACGEFADAPMDFVIESQVNNAVRMAENGGDRHMYNYLKKQYYNI
jgi:hypothetical protein